VSSRLRADHELTCVRLVRLLGSALKSGRVVPRASSYIFVMWRKDVTDMSMQKVIWLLVIGLLLGTFQTWGTSAVFAAEGGPGENADVEIGGPGDGP
jgi:cephalosporin hydroxylase